MDLDLSDCEEISRSAALVVTAQIERSLIRRPRCLNGFSPSTLDPCRRLHGLGFYKHLNFDTPRLVTDDDEVDAITVVSGTAVTAELSRELERVAEVAQPLFGNEEFVAHIHEALSEAMANIAGHAYIKGVERWALTLQSQSNELNSDAPEWLRQQAKAEALRKWWIAGHADNQTGELLLFALDHGHSIPVIAPFRMKDALEEFWNANPKLKPATKSAATDAQLLEAVARARREGYGTGRRGRGFPSMIGLVEHEAVSGAVSVISGGALYEYRKPGGDEPATERAIPLSKKFNGTMIEWRIGGAR
ncbi:MAG: hypothetical protein EON91_02515 [Brevundimonas sp.]|uniref:hypothetical protein n=1 Tax=Brevundimonas sp. TaxID=1871086 RepID=UPI0011FB7CDB|nr:hypothetical protein [Brevundimonas sp.]RZJ19087.1 MAG: hypothetical protein EON91_02515 [Brevundimonas sp.]